MNKEAEMHLSELPNLNKPRSTFPYNQTIQGTMKVGYLYPLEWIECNPGDTLSLDFSHLTRAMTQMVPVMGNAFLDVQAFAVPERIIWKNWESFWGENKTGHWAPQVEYEIPQIEFPQGGWATGSLADALGIPPYKVTNRGTTSHLPFRAYCKIWSDWYRDENLQDPVYFTEDETTVTGKNYGAGWDYVTDTETGGHLLQACRFHDYFSSCLPDLQRGPSVEIPLGKEAPVIGGDKYLEGAGNFLNTTLSGSEIYNYQRYVNGMGDSIITDETGALGDYNSSVNLVTDLSNAVGASITQLRQAIAIQHFYEQLARGGGRYIEYLSNIWGVNAKDETLQRSTYLGGRRFPINIDQVLQTSSTDNVSPQGHTAAFSCTCNESDLFTFSATEHCMVFIMGVIRTAHVYEQGIARKFNRLKWTDYYIPTFDGLSDMGVLNQELYISGDYHDDEIFGYQESFADYRIQVDRVFGQLRGDSKDSQGNSNTLNVWTYADYYQNLPVLSSTWIPEDGANFKRTVTLQDEDNDQFIIDCYLKGKFSRVMPTYGIPGMNYI